MAARRRRVDTMEENRVRLLGAARRAFSRLGYAEASMDAFTAEAGLTRGALYRAFGDKLGLFGAVVAEVDAEMAARARRAAEEAADPWTGLLAECSAHIEMALDPEIRRIILLDGPAFLGDPSGWPSTNACMEVMRRTLAGLIEGRVIKPVDVEAATRLLFGAVFNAALWVAASEAPRAALPKAVAAFRMMAEGLLVAPPG